MNDEKEIKEKKKTNKRKWLFAAIAFIVLISLGYVYHTEILNAIITQDEQAQTVLNSVIMPSATDGAIDIRHGKINYEYSRGGAFAIKKSDRPIANSAFAISGTYRGTRVMYTSWDYAWTWEKQIIEKNRTLVNETLFQQNKTAFYNETYNETIYRGYNNDANLNWTVEFKFDYTPIVKQTTYITNNLGTIKDTVFYYVFDMLEGSKILLNSQRIELNRTVNYTLTSSLDRITPILRFNDEMSFMYEDLIANNYTISEIYIGEGYKFNRPRTKITAIGLVKPKRDFLSGETIVLDPMYTSYLYPAACGYIYNDWTSCTNAFSSNDARMTSAVIDVSTDFTNFSINIPARAIVVNLSIAAEAKYYCV